METAQKFERRKDLRTALILTGITIAWMFVEGGASLWLGARSNSLLLEAFGFDSVLELVSAFVLLWRLTVEWKRVLNDAQIEGVEHRASRIVGALLYFLAFLIVVSSASRLFLLHTSADSHESVWGILIGLTAKIGMPLLAAGKLKVAARLNSRALRADAIEAITCGYLSIVLMIGLAATRLLNWWWLDSVAALALIPFLLREAREAVTGECQCLSSHE